MKNAFRLVGSILALLVCFSSFAQKKTFHGFYVTLQGDTIKGIFTNYTGWTKSPSFVEFAPSGANSLVLTPINSTAFSIEGYDSYIAYTGNRLLNPIAEQEVTLSKNILSTANQYGEVRTFLREIAKSPQVSVYELNDNARINFFYKLPGQAPVELKYKRFFVQDRIVDSATYRQQISDLFGNEIRRQGLTGELERLPYGETALTAFLGKLFAVQKVERKSKNPTSGWVASAGISYNFLNVTGDENIDAVGQSYDGSLSPLLSLGYLRPIGGTFSRYFIYPHLKLYMYKNTGETQDQRFQKISTLQSDVVVNAALNFGMHLVDEDAFRFFVSAGVGGMFLVNNQLNDRRYLLTDGSLFSSEEIKLGSVSYTFNVSPGFIIKNKIVLLASYSPPIPVAFYSYIKPRHSNLQVTIGYKFE